VSQVRLEVEDVNDEAPVMRVNALTPDGDALVDEHLPAGSFVAHLAVTDRDSGSAGHVRNHVHIAYLYTGSTYLYTGGRAPACRLIRRSPGRHRPRLRLGGTRA